MIDARYLKKRYPEYTVKQLKWGINFVGAIHVYEYLQLGGKLNDLEDVVRACLFTGIGFEDVLKCLRPYGPGSTGLADFEKTIRTLKDNHPIMSGQEKRRERRKNSRS